MNARYRKARIVLCIALFLAISTLIVAAITLLPVRREHSMLTQHNWVHRLLGLGS